MGGELPAPTVTTQNGEQVTVDGLEAIVVSGALDSEGEALVIYRLKQELVIDGASYGEYYLYSNPFTVTRDGGVRTDPQARAGSKSRAGLIFLTACCIWPQKLQKLLILCFESAILIMKKKRINADFSGQRKNQAQTVEQSTLLV